VTRSSGTQTTRTLSFWKWKGHDIFTEVRRPTTVVSNNNSKPPITIILLHGFGASTTYWRDTLSVLEQEGKYDIHALDFIGQGRSSKPVYSGDNNLVPTNNLNDDVTSSGMIMGRNTNINVHYSILLWSQMVDDYAREFGLTNVVLMGNSLGSLVALSATTESNYLRGKVQGLCLFNCGVGLNSRNIVKNPMLTPLQRTMFNLLFDVLNLLIFNNKILLRYALNNIVTKELLKDALRSLYMHSKDRVDDELINSFYYPAKMGGDGAVEAIRQIYTNDAGLTPMEYHTKYSAILDNLPIHLIWGLDDVVTPITGDVGVFYCDRVANNRSGNGKTTLDVIQKSGHIPFDDNPIETHTSMLRWLEKKILTSIAV
jgi:pimeloyl-ACP methyl ester carboxylesterase